MATGFFSNLVSVTSCSLPLCSCQEILIASFFMGSNKFHILDSTNQQEVKKAALLCKNGQNHAVISIFFNPVVLRTAKTLWSFGCSECKRVKKKQNNFHRIVRG